MFHHAQLKQPTMSIYLIKVFVCLFCVGQKGAKVYLWSLKTWGHTIKGQFSGFSSLLPSYRSWKSNSGCQPSRQALSLTEQHCQHTRLEYSSTEGTTDMNYQILTKKEEILTGKKTIEKKKMSSSLDFFVQFYPQFASVIYI